MRRLQELVGISFVRYLLYCPRPDYLDEATRLKLRHLRNMAVSDDIFDFALGLQLRDDIMSERPSVDAGLFVAAIDPVPHTLGETHAALFRGTLPFAWFLLCHLVRDGRYLNDSRDVLPRMGTPGAPVANVRGEQSRPHEIAQKIVTGDQGAIEDLVENLEIETANEFRFLPAHTITIEIKAGALLGENSQSRHHREAPRLPWP